MNRNVLCFSLVLTLGFVMLFALAANAEEVYSFADEKLPEDWHIGAGEWEVMDGALTVDASDEMATIFFGDPKQQNYEVSAKITFESVNNPSRWASIIFRAGPEGKTPWSQVPIRFNTKARNGIEFAVRTDKGWSVRRTGKSKTACKLGKARTLRVVVQGTTVEAYLDGKKLLRSAFCVDRDQGCLGLAAAGCEVAFDDITIKPLPASKTKFADMKRKPCVVVAHRGYSGVAPENTLSSARAAIKAGATGSEFDIRMTSDGHIVLMHDLGVKRTTNGKGKIADLPFAKLRKLDAGSWKGKKFAGEKIPTLDETLAVFKGSGCIPVIEIKVKGISKQVVEAVRKADMLDEAAVIAFDGDIVREVRELEPRLPCYWLWSKGLNGTPEQQAAAIVREAAKHKTNMVDLHYGMLSAEIVAELKRRGMKVWCWTVNSPMVMDALMRWGVEGITTDYPNELVRLNKEIEK
ncbi:MAG: glycerophosphodiester phosphodiesterase family protein [Planctomycetia bacterium]